MHCIYFPTFILQSHINSISAHLDLKLLTNSCEVIFFRLKPNFYVEVYNGFFQVKLYTTHGSIKYQTDCAPNTGYYLIPLYEKADFILKVEPPKGWSFGM